MAPRVTSSSTRAGRKPAKPPVVTTSKGRGNRSSVSTAKVSSGSNGKPPAAGARVTNASQRTNTGSARVTGSSRPALPPSNNGTLTKPSSKPTPPRSNGGPVQPVRVRDMGKPSSALPSGGARGLLGPGGAPPKAVLDLLNKGQPALPGARKGGRVNMGGAGGALLLAAGGAAANYVGTKAGEAIGTGLRNASNSPKTGDNRSNRPGGGSNKTPKTGDRPGLRYEKLFDTKGGRGNYGLDKANPVAPLPASVRQSSSAGGSSTPSRGGSTPSRSGSPSPARSSTPAAPAKPGQKFADFNPGRGTSKTNNPLMKDMIARMKDREDKAQSSAASKLTNKFNTNDNFSGEKVDGSKVDTKAKINSTTSEYDKKKRRYGG